MSANGEAAETARKSENTQQTNGTQSKEEEDPVKKAKKVVS